MNAPEQAWLKLRLKCALANSVEDIDRNIEFALQRKYTPFTELIGKESGAVSIVGSGPSLKKNWKKLRDSGTDIIACNAACQFLLERGVVPKYMFCHDADPLIYEFFTKHEEITFLIASRVPPPTWDLLEGCKVVVWHLSGDANIEALLQKHGKMEPMITGGSAAVTRCMHLVEPMGYDEIHIWGGDSSFTETDTHIRQSTTVEKRTSVLVNKRRFETSPWMAQQAEDFKLLVPAFTNCYGIRITVHGDGLLPHVARTMMEEGCPEYEAMQPGMLRVDDGEPAYRHHLREWKWKARALWQHL